MLNRKSLYSCVVALVVAMSAPLTVFAQGAVNMDDMPSAAQMFENFSDASLALMDLVVGVCFVMGIIVTIIGLMKFKESAEGRMKLSTPLGLVGVGCMMIIMPGMINMATETLSLGANTGKSILSEGRIENGAAAQMAGAIKGILLFVKLIGHIAFFRGLLILRDVSNGSQGASVGRALTHLLGGAAAINIDITASMLGATFGIPLFL